MCRTLRAKRISKSEAARQAGVCRRTVIRYAEDRRISSNRKGRVFYSELIAALGQPKRRPKKEGQLKPDHLKAGNRLLCRPRAFRLIKTGSTHTSPYRLAVKNSDFIADWKMIESELRREGVTASAVLRARKLKRAMAWAVQDD